MYLLNCCVVIELTKKKIVTYQAWICMVMNDTGELVQTTTTKTRKSKKGKGLNQNALHTCFCCHRKTNVVKLELNRSPSWLSYLGLLFHHFRSIFNFCFRPDDEKGGKWGQETAFIFGQIRYAVDISCIMHANANLFSFLDELLRYNKNCC